MKGPMTNVENQSKGKKQKDATTVTNHDLDSSNTCCYEFTSENNWKWQWENLQKALNEDAMNGVPSYIQGFLLDGRQRYVVSSKPIERQTAWAIASEKMKLVNRVVFTELKKLVDVGGYFEAEK
jgi:hypothetical protein